MNSRISALFVTVALATVPGGNLTLWGATPAGVVPGKVYPYPIYTNNPPGKQLTGVYAAASTPPLPPGEAVKKFTVPEGFEVRLFASEPEVVNPVAMTWDERGRLWVVELYEYPNGAEKGAPPRDRVKILEDTDADGRADKVTVFADGFNLATALLIGDGGVYVGQAPHLYFLKDTNGDDVADSKVSVMTGFGLEDRHELLNGFTWGPDGQLYMTHGVFTYSKVKNPEDPEDDGVTMTAAVARWQPGTRKFEIYAEGTSNPWGVDFDRHGNAFVSACVIDHLFHMAPGGLYVRQSGTPPHPYAYQLLPSVVDHKHFRAAYAGIVIYQGNQYPKEWLGHVMMGNVHQGAINHDRLSPNGSTFKATEDKDFLVSNDGWSRPVSVQCGPDGALWVMDWYDKYPCYQNANADPAGVDREHGRIWRVVYTGGEAGKAVPSRPSPTMDLKQLPSTELVALLEHPNVWHRRTAQRLLRERKDPAVRIAVENMFDESRMVEGRLAALWTLHASGQLGEGVLNRAAADRDPAIRSWSARLTGERRLINEAVRDRLLKLAGDSDPGVRLSVATALRQYASGALTVNKPLPAGMPEVDTGSILAPLIRASADGKDPLIPFMIWMAAEPGFAKRTEAGLRWLAQEAPSIMPLGGQLAYKAMRRICDLNSPEKLDEAVEFLVTVADSSPELAVAAINGLLEGQKGKALLPASPTTALLAKLGASSNAALKERGQQLGALWGDAAAVVSLIQTLRDTSKPVADRQQAILGLRKQKNDGARDALLETATQSNPDLLVSEAIMALGEVGGDAVAEVLINKWATLPAAARRATAEVLVSRRNWARVLLTAIERKTVSAGDVPPSTLRALVNSKDDYVRNNAARAIGRVREADADRMKLIAAKRAMVLEGQPNLQNGHEVARKSCFVCHKLHGEGADVGPDLTGVGRSTLDALLRNVIHPNEIIGKGYENVEVETKDGRTINGRVTEDTNTQIKLVSAGPKEDVVSKSEIASMRVTELSLMPEGLEQMPDNDFRDLIWYILNPPQDKRPMTPALMRELRGE